MKGNTLDATPIRLTNNPKTKKVYFYGHVSGKPIFCLANHWNTGPLFSSVTAAITSEKDSGCVVLVDEYAWKMNTQQPPHPEFCRHPAKCVEHGRCMAAICCID